MSERLPSLIVVSAPSGAGKSTVLARVLGRVPALRFSVSHTTRAPREGELDGVEYHFVSREAFESLARSDRLLEWAHVHGQLYGTAKAEYERARERREDLLLDIDVQGADQVRARFPAAVSVFILPPSYAVLEQRLRTRGQDDEASIRRRLETARREVPLYRRYDHVVINDDIEICVDAVISIIRAARSRTSQVEEAAARVLATFLPFEEPAKNS